MKKFFVVILGVLLMLAGIVGIILPIMPGWVLFFLGLSFIAPRLARRLKNRFFRRFLKSDIVYFEEWKKTRARAGFTTRRFPLLLQKSEEMLEEDNQIKFVSLLRENPVVTSHNLGPYDRFAVLNQVHGDKIALLEDAGAYLKPGFYPMPGCDGAVTNLPGLTLLAFSADCLTLFFSAGLWVGLVHAGWRGTQNQVAVKVLKLLSEKSGRLPKNIKIILGPSISTPHYEVGQEFKALFKPSSLEEKKGKLYLDLVKENVTQLREAGAVLRNISDHEICTYAEPATFYSFRREKEKAGRQISFISLS